MRLWLIALAVGLLVFVLVARGFVRADPKKVIRGLKWLGIGLALGALVYLAATGRLHWLAALFGSLLAVLPRIVRVLMMIPALRQLKAQFQSMRSGGRPSAGQTSRVATRFLDMTLDHDTGAMTGRVLIGAFAGRMLDELNLDDLMILLGQCRTEDSESAALLEAFLDRSYGDEWRDRFAGGERAAPGPSGPMTRDEACQILGVDAGAGEDEIIAAHRRLMQKLHPDRGGSDYLAAKINQAKDLLLGS